MRRSSSYAGQASFAQSITGKISEILFEDIVAKRSSLERSLAERAGFEPAIPLRVYLISNQAHSATMRPLLNL